jgi:hypothetical protein
MYLFNFLYIKNTENTEPKFNGHKNNTFDISLQRTSNQISSWQENFSRPRKGTWHHIPPVEMDNASPSVVGFHRCWPLVTTLSPPFADRTAGTHLSDPEPSNLDRTDHNGSNTSMSGLTAWPRPARRACRRRPCPNRPHVRWLATKEC